MCIRDSSWEERDGLLADADQIIAWSRDAVQLVGRLHAADPVLYDEFGSFRSNILSIVGVKGELDFYDGSLRVRDADGQIIVDGVGVQDYQQLISEEVKPWSYMKFPFPVSYTHLDVYKRQADGALGGAYGKSGGRR